jgi:hypothetical protein
MGGSAEINHGWLRWMNVTNPAAGAGFVLQIATGVRWRVLGCMFSFTADATVISREVYYEYVYAGVVMGSVVANCLHGAGAAVWYSMMGGVGERLGVLGGSVQIPHDTRVEFNTVHYIRVNAINIQAGDQFASINWYSEQWLDDYV